MKATANMLTLSLSFLVFALLAPSAIAADGGADPSCQILKCGGSNPILAPIDLPP